jgi:hypothetical protein
VNRFVCLGLLIITDVSVISKLQADIASLRLV